MKRGAIQHRMDVGRLHPVHAGVYAVGHPRLVGKSRWMAAVLACGEHALLSHLSAAALWGLLQVNRSKVDVTVAGRSRRSCAGICLHQPRSLSRSDTTTRDGIPVTTVARTLLDLAEAVDERRLARAWEEAERLRLLDVSAINGLLQDHPNRRGTKALRDLVRERRTAAPTRSEFESLFLDLCREHGLDLPQVNTLVEGFEVDAAWRDRQLVVELDGYEFHRTRRAFERDRTRDVQLQLAGYRVVRLTYRRVTTEPDRVASIMRRLLDPVASSAWPKR